MATLAFRRPLRRVSRIADAVIVAVGHVIGWAMRSSRFLPGLGGAAAISCGLGEIAGHIWGHGLSPWVAILVAGFFLLRIDGRITITITPRSQG